MTRRWPVRGLLAAFSLFAAAVLAARLAPLPDRLTVPGSPVVTWRDGTVAHVFLAPDERWRMPVRLDQVDPDYIAALIALEDERFAWHPGVDPVAVARAAAQNVGAGRVVSGASTITMQVVRMVEPRPRTLRSKVVETARALTLEARLSKAEILSAYLTFVPYGRNVEGIEAASWSYFGHSAAVLSPAEICTLLAVPQNPNRRYPTPDHAEGLRAARDDIARRLADLDALRQDGSVPDDVLGLVLDGPVPTTLRPMPRAIPHAAREALALRHDPGVGPLGPPPIRTTLDRGIQAQTERAIAAARPWAEQRDIFNAVAVVADHETGEVRALVGSFDFWDDAHGGQIAGFSTARSPGSTLKPFVYATALDRGLVLPERLVADVPVRYGTYTPENYDGEHSGVVTLEQALSRSLNVPFVDLLSEVGVEPFLGQLRGMGVGSIDPRPGHYGLSLVAGGIELTPLELAGMYVALAEGGRWQPLRWLADQATARPIPAYSPGATWLTRRALSIKDRPDFPDRGRMGGMPRHIHWKTGTSFGYRDAWAVGSDTRHTALVWLGNFDNAPSRHLVGAQAAGPVLFDLLEGLQSRDDPPPTPAPPDLGTVTVCSLSGYLPGAGCTQTREVLALRQHVPTERCPFHQPVEVDTETGRAVNPSCRAGRRTETRSVVRWPAAVARWLDDRYRQQDAVPALADGCAPTTQDPPPRILSPASGQVAMLIPGLSPDAQDIPLEATGAASRAELSWFLDGAFVGRAGAGDRVWWTPEPGGHELVVMDGAGRSDVVRFEVRAGG